MRTITMIITAGLVLTGPGIASASPEGPIQETHALDGHDHHRRPAPYDDPTLAVPPSQGGAADYPLAVGLSPAHPSNYTPGGLSSPQYVVIHTMQGYYAGSISWFQNPSANVSAHYCMRAEDGEITQTVRDQDRAWHVGGSNPVALGIEHEGFIDEPGWYTWVTYVESARLARWLCDTYEIPIDRDHIVGHVELPNQTHTDPGPLWDWDLYMALIEDVVPQGRVEGVVVDRSRACNVTVAEDTWLKTTPEPSEDLSDEQRCWVTAGTELAVVYEYDPLQGHRRLVLDDDDPCASALGGPAFAFDAHLSGACAPDHATVAGAQIRLDGAVTVDSDDAGGFSFDDVAVGAHTLEVSGAQLAADSVPVEVAVYPGTRVVLVTDPLAEPPDPGQDDGGADSTGGSPGDGGHSGDRPADDDLPAGTGDTDPEAPGEQALPPGFGEREGGCTCRSTGGGGAPALLLLLLGLPLRRRRLRR
ncbi:MAG: N-acetylmuramoyl-L-alanine amidase [Myxococcota bacterium]